jgi:hypothetical protein
MKNVFTFGLFFICLLCIKTQAQISTMKVHTQEVKTQKYDSLINFLGKDYMGYLGQELYVIPKHKDLREYGYEGFGLDYTQSFLLNDKNVYKCCESFNSKYDDLQGKYFSVIDIIKNDKDDNYFHPCFFKLVEKESKDTVYYSYSPEFEHSFPFMVVGYFEKLKQLYIGVDYISRGKNVGTDVNTGKAISAGAGTKWKCKDVTIEEEYYNLVLVVENEKGEKLPFALETIKDKRYFITLRQSETLKKKYGLDNWKKIIDGNVNVGMTSEMCRWSWGEPSKINRTTTARGNNEQWVYSNNYLYFENGVLTTIQ